MKTNLIIKNIKWLSIVIYVASKVCLADGVGGPGGTYSCKAKKGVSHTLQDFINESKNMETTFGEYYSEYSQLLKNIDRIRSEKIRNKIIESVENTRWIRLDKFECDIEVPLSGLATPLVVVLEPFYLFGHDRHGNRVFLTSKEFASKVYNGSSDDLNGIRFSAFLSTLIKNCNVPRVIDENYCGTAKAEIGSLIYNILKQNHSNDELELLNDRLDYIINATDESI